MLADALEHLVRGLVANPDDVRVTDSDRRRPRTLEVRVHPEDIGKVIGRQGRTADAIRELRDFRELVPDADRRIPADLRDLAAAIRP